ncbi:anti-repressor SinI family protein [Tenuibacillus multivorans]|nr:anti-repressor SinI family protein [Tenuibacillus multivorans]GEL77718.1 hypothetical protein TMU01_19530 [Tenuibacillus multivorans]
MSREQERLDRDWLELIKQANKMGLSRKEVRHYLHQKRNKTLTSK